MYLRSFNNPAIRTLSLLTLLAATAWLLQPAPITAQGQGQGQGQGGGGLQQRLADLEEELLLTQEVLLDLQETLAHVRMEEGELNGLAGPHLIIEGCNLHVRNAAEFTDEINGTGNLIVGYNEIVFGAPVRTGSHNLVVGPGHSFTSWGGFVAGINNSVTGTSAAVSGGFQNVASGSRASVSGGAFNEANGIQASVSGGTSNFASGERASVSGGAFNDASGQAASISGGGGNDASGFQASVSGGSFNEASGFDSSVSGGRLNDATHDESTVSGGLSNATAVFGDHVP
jgi:hypothetical protein